MVQGWIKNAVEVTAQMARQQHLLTNERITLLIQFLSDNPNGTFEEFCEHERASLGS
jgi:hypothetical protein